jgi:polysaccharide chain length determinant protein (PEP-CTERM system associated)
MNEQIQQARRYVRMVWPHRWAAILTAIAVCLVGWSYALVIPNIYEVNAKIFVDTQSMLRPLLKGLAVDTNVIAQNAVLLQRTLLTRPNLEDVARKADLDLETETARDFELLVARLAQKITFTGTSRDNIYQIAIEDPDVNRAKRIVDELLNRFLETALGSSRLDTEVTQKFLDDQIREYETRLTDAEERLKEFKQRNVGKMPRDGANYFQNLQATRERLKNAEVELQEARNRSYTLEQQLADAEKSAINAASSGAPGVQLHSSYDERIDRLEDQLDQLLLLYTDKHPEIVALTQQLAQLSSKREDELKALPSSMTDNVGAAGASVYGETYQQIQLAKAEAAGEVAALAARVSAYQEDVLELEKAVDVVPEIEAELKRLDRDYGLNRNQYEELLKRRESARLAEQADESADDIKLKVIEPPRIPLEPIGPNRVRLLVLVLLAAFGIGGGVAVLLSQVKPRFYSSEELREVTQLPVLGTISFLASNAQRRERRMELLMAGVVLSGLLTFFAILVGLEANGFNLHAKLVTVVGEVSR